jgi:calcyclin binding protein
VYPTYDTMASTTNTNNNAAAGLRSQERFQDADEIETFLANTTRPSAKLHLENLVLKLRKEGKALQRVEESTTKAASSDSSNNIDVTANNNNDEENHSSIMELEQVDGPSLSSTTTTTVASTARPPATSTKKYLSFPTILFDAGKYNSPIVTVYLPLPGIGQHDPTKISCNFTSSSFDIIVSDYQNKSYRLLNNNLEKDIDVSQSKYVVKSNKIIVKLGKIKGEYGSYDTWTQLTSKKDKKSREASKDSSNPAAGIMDLMKDMYDEGDENMKKMIGETMYKQRMGQLNNKDDMLGGAGGFGGMGDMMDM